MYTWEMKKFIADRKGKLTKEENLFLQDHEKHPQIIHVFYDAGQNRMHLEDKDGEQVSFTPILLEDKKMDASSEHKVYVKK